MMKKIIALFCFIASVQTVFAQDIDSLLSKIAAEKNDNFRVEIMINFFSNTSEIDPILFLKNAQKLLVYSQKNKDRISETLAISSIGYNYRGLGNTEKALEYGLKADAIARETGNEILVAITDVRLGNTYKDLANYSKSIHLYLEAAEIGARIKFDRAQSLGFQNLGEVYLAINKIDSALMYAQKDYELCMRIQYFDYFGYTLLNLGSIHGKLGNAALAIGYYDMAIQQGFKTNSAKQLNWAYTSKAEYFNDINQRDSSILYAKKAMAAVENTPFSNYSIKPAKLLLALYKTTNSDSALKYSEIYRIANDSLFSSKTIQQTQLMTFENEMKQQEITAEKLKAEEQRKQNIQFALIALGIITFIISFLLLSRRHITNTKLIQFLGVVALLVVFEFLNLLLHPF